MIEEILNKLKSIEPEYTTELPCAKKVVSYSPFKIKDEKTLALISEEKHIGIILKNLCALIKSCTSEKNPENLSLCDLEYLFLQLRAKSVEEKINLVLDQIPPITFAVNINEIKIKDGLLNQRLVLSNSIEVDLQQPKVKDYFDLSEINESELLSKAIKAITIDKHRYEISILKTKEIVTILDELQIKHNRQLKEFLNNAPKLTYLVETESEPILIEGFLRFFI